MFSIRHSNSEFFLSTICHVLIVKQKFHLYSSSCKQVLAVSEFLTMILLDIWKLLLLGLLIQLSNALSRSGYDNNNGDSESGLSEFDIIVFSQTWPQAECIVWRQKLGSNKCNLPYGNEWTIHGIWPSALRDIGPASCTNVKLNISNLKSMRKDLDIKWMNVHAGYNSESFWKHEWSKHGTCSSYLESVSDEIKYFQKGLDLYDKYNAKNILDQLNIFPGGKYPVTTILYGVRQVLGVNIQIKCCKNMETGESILHEIRICFDKSFQIVNCDGILGFPSNCNKYQDVVYVPGKVQDNNLEENV